MKNSVNQINRCEVCGNNELVSVLSLGEHPMCDDLIRIGDPRECKEYPIDILFCNRCFTAHQKYQVSKQDLFPQTYHYRSRFTADVINGMKGLVEKCVEHFGNLSGAKVLDVGCNDGSLLGFFRENGAITIGIEPTGACSDAKSQGHITYNNFLTPELADKIVLEQGKPDYIVFTNVFAHIEDLSAVLESLRCLISNTTTIIIENHYLGSVLDGNQFDTFYHEHPRTYSYKSFSYIAHSLGLCLVEVEFPARYGGNIRVFMKNPDTVSEKLPANVDYIINNETRFMQQFISMKKNIDIWRSKKRKIIESLVIKNGKIAAKAFPGRAAILVKLLNLDADLISAVYEKPGSLKIGNYVPGTRIPIKSDNDLFNSDELSSPILNLAWHISDEIRLYLSKHDYTGEVIDIISKDDFI
jgi:hypothetical protein